jgi:hypothetical protein
VSEQVLQVFPLQATEGAIHTFSEFQRVRIRDVLGNFARFCEISASGQATAAKIRKVLPHPKDEELHQQPFSYATTRKAGGS